MSEFAWFINDQRLSTVSTQMMIISQISVEQGSVSCRAGNVAGWSEAGHSHLTVNIGPTLTQGGFQFFSLEIFHNITYFWKYPTQKKNCPFTENFINFLKKI